MHWLDGLKSGHLLAESRPLKYDPFQMQNLHVVLLEHFICSFRVGLPNRYVYMAYTYERYWTS